MRKYKKFLAGLLAGAAIIGGVFYLNREREIDKSSLLHFFPRGFVIDYAKEGNIDNDPEKEIVILSHYGDRYSKFGYVDALNEDGVLEDIKKGHELGFTEWTGLNLKKIKNKERDKIIATYKEDGYKEFLAVYELDANYFVLTNKFLIKGFNSSDYREMVDANRKQSSNPASINGYAQLFQNYVISLFVEARLFSEEKEKILDEYKDVVKNAQDLTKDARRKMMELYDILKSSESFETFNRSVKEEKIFDYTKSPFFEVTIGSLQPERYDILIRKRIGDSIIYPESEGKRIQKIEELRRFYGDEKFLDSLKKTSFIDEDYNLIDFEHLFYKVMKREGYEEEYRENPDDFILEKGLKIFIDNIDSLNIQYVLSLDYNYADKTPFEFRAVEEGVRLENIWSE